jgi:hypothetical protein
MAKSSKFLTPETLRSKGEGSGLIWNPKALDWPLRPLADEDEANEVRVAIMAYLDQVANARSGRKPSEIRNEIGRASRRLCEIILFFQRAFDHAEDIASGRRDFHTGKVVPRSRRRVFKKVADDEIPF